MKIINYFLILSFLLVVLPSQSQAQSQDLCLPTPVTVIFSNGVFNTEREAIFALDKLEFLVEKDLKEAGFIKGKKLFRCFNEFLEFELQYNRTDGLADVLEAAAQNWMLEFARYWRMRSTKEDSQEFRDLFLGLSGLFDKAQYEIDPDLVQWVEVYSQEDQIDIDVFKNGEEILKRKILRIAVSHSQGNFYSNIVWTNLPSENKSLYRIIAVATPDSMVGGNGPYITYEDDLVINEARSAQEGAGIQPALIGNEPPAEFGTLTSHLFLEDYLRKNTNSRDFILDNISNHIPRSSGCFLPTWPHSNSDGFNQCLCESTLPQSEGGTVVTPNEAAFCDCWLHDPWPNHIPICGD